MRFLAEWDRCVVERLGATDRHSHCDNAKKTSAGWWTVESLDWFNYLAFDVIGSLAFGEPFGMVERAADIVLVENEHGKTTQVRSPPTALALILADARRPDPERARRVLGHAGLPSALDPPVSAQDRPLVRSRQDLGHQPRRHRSQPRQQASHRGQPERAPGSPRASAGGQGCASALYVRRADAHRTTISRWARSSSPPRH